MARAVPVPRGDRFTAHGSNEISRALQYAGEASGLKYAVVVRGAGDGTGHGVRTTAADDLVTDTAAWAAGVHARMVDPPRSVLVAVDTDARAVRVVTGARSGRRLRDDDLIGVVEVMAQLFATRGLVQGLVAGLQQLGQVAGPPRRARVG